MAHFAKLDENNVVVEVRAVGNDIPTSNGPLGENDMHPDGETYCSQAFGGVWKQTSYHNNFRKKFAGIGNIYNEDLDIFTCPQPNSDFTLNANGDWVGPVPFPDNVVFDTTGPVDDNDPPTMGPIKMVVINIVWNVDNQRFEGVDHNGNPHSWDASTKTWS